MTVRVPLIVAILLAVLGLVLAAATAIVAVAGSVRAAGSPEDRQRFEAAESRRALLLLLVATLGLIRLMAWPNFYGLLRSQVDDLAALGVMCAYGVTRVHPRLVRTIEVLRPLVLLLLGFWLVAWPVASRAQSRVHRPSLNVLALAIALLAAVDCGLELAYLRADRSGPRITCCTQFFEVPWSLRRLDAESTAAMTPVLRQELLASGFAVNALIVASSLVLAIRGVPQAGPRRLLWPSLLVGLGTLGLYLGWTVGWEVLSPRVLHAPAHRCLYELITDTRMLGLAAALTIAALGCLSWPLMLALLPGADAGLVAPVQRRIYGACAIALAAATVMVAAYL